MFIMTLLHRTERSSSHQCCYCGSFAWGQRGWVFFFFFFFFFFWHSFNSSKTAADISCIVNLVFNVILFFLFFLFPILSSSPDYMCLQADIPTINPSDLRIDVYKSQGAVPQLSSSFCLHYWFPPKFTSKFLKYFRVDSMLILRIVLFA